MRATNPRRLAIGFFDGVHLGHQAILHQADVALTFRTHPLSVLAPTRTPRLIMSADDRLATLRALGVREVIALDFTPEMAARPPADFVRDYLVPAGAPGELVVSCGANWRFGRGGAGDANFLRTLGYTVDVVPYANYAGETISSSRIRRALADGALADAAAMLGRPHRRTGRIVRGKGEGARLGFPTVNLDLNPTGIAADLIDLPCGVYDVSVDGAKGMANWGVAPTMGARAWTSPILEIHFLQAGTWSALRAGENMTVDFHRFLRPERQFASVDELRAQITADRERIHL